MIHPCISKDLEEHALWLILRGYAPDNICELLDISLSKQYSSTVGWPKSQWVL